MNEPWPGSSPPLERRAFRTGLVFQTSMLLLAAVRLYLLCFAETVKVPPLWVCGLSQVGVLTFFYCLHLLYASKRKDRKLIENGLFRYTRHPMYTAMAAMDSMNWYMNQPWYVTIGSGLLFYLCLITAGYCQELETIGRYGDRAREYYARTPRLFIWYPITKWQAACQTTDDS